MPLVFAVRLNADPTVRDCIDAIRLVRRKARHLVVPGRLEATPDCFHVRAYVQNHIGIGPRMRESVVVPGNVHTAVFLKIRDVDDLEPVEIHDQGCHVCKRIAE